MKRFDFLVIGGGIAGLTYALQAAEHGTVAVLFKKGITESSTSWAQGGVAAVTTADDSFALHVEDTLTAGAGLCNRNIVELVVKEGPERIHELISLGTTFDKKDGSYHLNQEGGHSRRRIFHAGDGTGHVVLQTLIAATQKHNNIQFFPYALAIDIITTHKLNLEKNTPNRVLGAYVHNEAGNIESFVASKVLVATGGAGKIYLYTSNPDVATGDGIAMCYRAGVSVANLEFFQFHPTCLYHPKAKSFLITEAMRGEGGYLRRITGERFMEKYHKDAELAPRDIVARAIDSEMKKHGEDFVLLDITHRSKNFIIEHFPNIYQKCLEYGFDITTQPIPVVPAAHYCCGGVVCDTNGQTSIADLYVAGETAHTGLHGANRLASNSLLEGLVFGYRAAADSIASFKNKKKAYSVPDWDPGKAVDSDEQVIISQNWDEIRTYMWNYVGIVRSSKRLTRALHRSELIEREIDEYYWNFKVTPPLIELRNLSLVSQLVIKSALFRKESRGLHFTIDYPETITQHTVDTVITPIHD